MFILYIFPDDNTLLFEKNKSIWEKKKENVFVNTSVILKDKRCFLQAYKFTLWSNVSRESKIHQTKKSHIRPSDRREPSAFRTLSVASMLIRDQSKEWLWKSFFF